MCVPSSITNKAKHIHPHNCSFEEIVQSAHDSITGLFKLDSIKQRWEVSAAAPASAPHSRQMLVPLINHLRK